MNDVVVCFSVAFFLEVTLNKTMKILNKKNVVLFPEAVYLMFVDVLFSSLSLSLFFCLRNQTLGIPEAV